MRKHFNDNTVFCLSCSIHLFCHFLFNESFLEILLLVHFLNKKKEKRGFGVFWDILSLFENVKSKEAKYSKLLFLQTINYSFRVCTGE